MMTRNITALFIAMTAFTSCLAAADKLDQPPRVNSQVFDDIAGIKTEHGRVQTILGSLAVELSPELSEKLNSLPELAELGKNDPNAASKYMAAEAEVMVGIHNSLNVMIARKPEIMKQLNDYGTYISENKKAANEQMEDVEKQLKSSIDTKNSLHTVAREVADIAAKVKSKNGVVPDEIKIRITELQNMMLNNERQVQTRKNQQTNQQMLLDIFDQAEQERSLYKERVERYFAEMVSDRDYLETKASGRMTIIRIRQVHSIRNSLGRPNPTWGAALKQLVSSQETVDSSLPNLKPAESNADIDETVNSFIDKYSTPSTSQN